MKAWKETEVGTKNGQAKKLRNPQMRYEYLQD